MVPSKTIKRTNDAILPEFSGNAAEPLLYFSENAGKVKTVKTRRKTGMLQFCPLRDNRTSARLLCCIQPKNASSATMLENYRDAGARKRRVPARSQRAPARRATRSAQGLGKPQPQARASHAPPQLDPRQAPSTRSCYGP